MRCDLQALAPGGKLLSISLGLVCVDALLVRAVDSPGLELHNITAAISNEVARTEGLVLRGTCIRTSLRMVDVRARSGQSKTAHLTEHLEFRVSCYSWGYLSRTILQSASGSSVTVVPPAQIICLRSNDLSVDLTLAPKPSPGVTNTAAGGGEARVSGGGRQPGFPSYPVLPHTVLALLDMLDSSSVRVGPVGPPSSAARDAVTIRIEGHPRYDARERWEVDLVPRLGMRPVETRFYAGNGTLAMRTRASIEGGASYWFPQEVTIEAFKDGELTGSEKYTGLTAEYAQEDARVVGLIPPGTHVEDHRLPTPVAYTMGSRAPTQAELEAMQGNPEAVKEYLRLTDPTSPAPRVRGFLGLAVLLGIALGTPIVLRISRAAPPAA